MRKDHQVITALSAAVLAYCLVYISVSSYGRPVVRVVAGGLSYASPNHLELRMAGNFIFAPLRRLDNLVSGEDIDFASPGPQKFKIHYRF